MDILKLFQRDDAEDPETRLTAVSQPGAQIVDEIRDILLAQLERGGIAPDILDIDVRCLGRANDGREVYQGMLRLSKWDRRAVVRLLLGLPLLQAKVRRTVHASWVHDVAHFTGLWLHPSAQFEETGGMEELRGLILALERPAEQGEPDRSLWSLPLELREEPPA